jgi:pectate lyase
VRKEQGDAITIQAAFNVWVDHCDLSSDRDHGKDYYDGLVDIVHGSDSITVSNTHFHDHFKASLVGHTENTIPKEDEKAHLHVTYYNNRWTNINSRTPSLRLGTGHIFNSYFEGMDTGINTRLGAEVLVQGNVFVNVTKPLFSVDGKGFAVQKDNDFGGVEEMKILPQPGKLNGVPYKYVLGPTSQVKQSARQAGNSLSFGGK